MDNPLALQHSAPGERWLLTLREGGINATCMEPKEKAGADKLGKTGGLMEGEK
jgi:hypothetical protein